MKPSPLSKALRNFAETLIPDDGDLEAIDREQKSLDHSTCAELVRVLARIVEGKSIDKAFGAPGDWGYGTPIGDGVFARLKEPAADESGVQWNYVGDEMPDDETRVMIAIESDATDEPDYGYHADGKWWFDAAPHLSPVEAKVYAWAHVPGLPPRKTGGAS